MNDFLVFTLTAPMGAFGDLAGHERRGSALWPGRSAILGLLGAAQGIRRTDKEGHEKLDQWRMAVSVLAAGNSLRDYHTVQTVPQKVKRPNSRREALAEIGRKVNTIITQRDYRTDVCFGVALWSEEAVCSLENMKACLDKPVFALYLGRKSCPLSGPVAAKVVQATDPLAALTHVELPPWLAAGHSFRDSPGSVRVPDPKNPVVVASDPFEGVAWQRSEIRWDQPTDRSSWHFSRRIVHLHHPRGGE